MDNNEAYKLNLIMFISKVNYLTKFFIFYFLFLITKISEFNYIQLEFFLLKFHYMSKLDFVFALNTNLIITYKLHILSIKLNR